MLTAVKMEDSGREYKTYRGLRADLEPPEMKDRPGRSIHLFLGRNSWTSLSGHLNPDGTYAGTLAMKNGGEQRTDLDRHWGEGVAQQCCEARKSNEACACVLHITGSSVTHKLIQL